MSRIRTGTGLAEWRTLVMEAAGHVDEPLDEELESYLVMTLERFTREAHRLSGVMAMEFLEALHHAGELRSREMRDVGDQCLLLAGLFPHRAQRRRVSMGYFVDLGAAAYQEVSQYTSGALALLFRQLAQRFLGLTEVLHGIRDLSGTGAPGLLESLELAESHPAYRGAPRLAGVSRPANRCHH